MNKLFSPRVKGILIAALVIAILCSVTALVRSEAAFVSNALNAILRPVRNAVTSIAEQVEGYYNYIFQYELIAAENQDLKARLASAQEQIRNAETYERENERLRNLLGLLEQHEDYKVVDAYISAWSDSNWNSGFTIDKGSSQGVSVGHCVITENRQVVGFVTEVGQNWSTVMSILDPTSEISAMVYGSGYMGVAQGDFELMEAGQLRMSYLTTDAVIRNGDQVLTTGSGDIYPQGLIIGSIIDVALDQAGVSKYAVIDPAAEVDALEQVFVITSYDYEG